ncbi:hypothetical protein A3715_23175 [Oleiphilus sp. HI0009]|nr:hypothetical protein A3715_23175 [Oleiphilus sp. HI0009]
MRLILPSFLSNHLCVGLLTLSQSVAIANTDEVETKDEETSTLSPSTQASVSFSEEQQEHLGQRTKATEGTPHPIKLLHKDVNYFVRGLMQDLMANLSFVNDKTPIAVSSFVLLDSNYQETNLLGLQISESLIHEVNKFGIPVIDFKSTSDIQVTNSGDFFFSKDPNKLAENLPIQFVIAGTLAQQQGGYIVNARIIGVSSKAVVSSAQAFISREASQAILDNARGHQAPTIHVTGG